MNSSESAAANGELILKTEEYEINRQHESYRTPISSFNQSLTTANRLVNAAVNLNNNLNINCNKVPKNSNSLSPKLEPYICPSATSSPDRMPIPVPVETQSATVAGTTPGQHSMSPSLPPPHSQQSQQLLPDSISNGNNSTDQHSNSRRMTSILGGYGLVPPGILGPLDHYRLQLYSYAMNVERLRGCGAPQQYPAALYPSRYPGSPVGPVGNGPYAPTRFALSMGLFPNRMFQPEEPKPQHSYIGLIAMAILSSSESKLVLSDIYQYILDNYPYFRSRGPGWRNSIRHNLSLNDCFIKAGRSANGKGHYWAVHPANLDDFRKGDFRRRKAQRKVRKHMGLAVDDEGTDSPSPPPLAITPPSMAPPSHPGVLLVGNNPYVNVHQPNHQHFTNPLSSVIISGSENLPTNTTTGAMANLYSQSRKRQFDVASLLAPDDTPNHHQLHHYHQHQQSPYKGHLQLMSKQRIALTEDEDIDVVASDVDDEQEHILRVDEDPYHLRLSNNHQTINNDATNSSSFSPPPDFNNRQVYQTSCSPNSQLSEPSSDVQASSNNNQNSTICNWQGLMQHWPNELGTAAAAAAAATMDPRIFGRYYSQYIAAAAARRAAAAAAAAAVIGQHHNSSTKQQSNAASSLQHKQQPYEC